MWGTYVNVETLLGDEVFELLRECFWDSDDEYTWNLSASLSGYEQWRRHEKSAN